MAEFEDEDVGSHEVNRQGTKPVMMPFLGLPWFDVVAFGFTAYQCIIFRWQLLVPLFAFMGFWVSLYRRDHYAGRRMRCWLLTSFRCLTGHYSGGTSIKVEPGRNVFRGML
jgi:hypothetical protein